MKRTDVAEDNLRASTSTKKSKQEPGNVSSTEESDVVRPTANLPIVDLRHRRENNALFSSESGNGETEKNC